MALIQWWSGYLSFFTVAATFVRLLFSPYYSHIFCKASSRSIGSMSCCLHREERHTLRSLHVSLEIVAASVFPARQNKCQALAPNPAVVVIPLSVAGGTMLLMLASSYHVL